MLVNLTIYNDGDYVRSFAYRQSDGTTPIDLTGGRLVMQFRRKAEAAEVDLMLSSDSGGGIVISNAAAGAFTVSLLKDMLAKLGLGIYAHALIYYRSDGVKLPIWHGAATIVAGAGR